jgi:hypothetical protein
LLSLLKNINLYIISIAVLENVPPTQGYKKEPLFHTNCRSGRDRGSNPGHLRGRQRRKTLSHPLRLYLPSSQAPRCGCTYLVSPDAGRYMKEPLSHTNRSQQTTRDQFLTHNLRVFIASHTIMQLCFVLSFRSITLFGLISLPLVIMIPVRGDRPFLLIPYSHSGLALAFVPNLRGDLPKPKERGSKRCSQSTSQRFQ